MTDNQAPTAADYRRAAALIHDHGHNNVEDMNKVLAEAADAGRNTALFFALLTLYQHIVPALITQHGRDCLGQVILSMAADPDIDVHYQRAAELIAHEGNSNLHGVNEVLAEADEADQIAELLMAILKLYAQLMPMLYTPLGLQTLRNTEMDFLAQELDNGDTR